MTPPAPGKPEPVTLRQQVAALPSYVLEAWRTRYGVTDGMDLEARALLNKEKEAAIRAEGVQSDALTVWMRLTDMVVRVGSPSPELIAAAALAGLAAGLRPQGFQTPTIVKPDALEAD